MNCLSGYRESCHKPLSVLTPRYCSQADIEPRQSIPPSSNWSSLWEAPAPLSHLKRPPRRPTRAHARIALPGEGGNVVFFFQTFIALPSSPHHPPGVWVPSFLVCGTGKDPHYYFFPPINNGQWYVGLLGNIPAQTGGGGSLWTLVTLAVG